MDFDAAALSATLGGITGLVAGLIPVLSKFAADRRSRADKIVIGVVGSVPALLVPFHDYTNLNKARASNYRVTVLHVKNPSYAFRHCDFVYGYGDDPKALDEVGLQSVLAGTLPDDTV